jgi:VWFA-related protein
VRGLKARDFTVREDGKPREVTTFASFADASGGAGAEWPVDFVMLLDTSGSMREDLRRARDAAVEFAGSIPSVRGRNIVSFNSKIQVWPYEETGPAPVLDRILAEDETGATNLFDAVLQSIPRVANDPTRRPIVVALTDGADTGALLRARDAAEPGERERFLRGLRPADMARIRTEAAADTAKALQNESVTFYAIYFAKHDIYSHGREVLNTLARATGGLVVDGGARDLTAQFGRIRNDLAAQYVLGFAPFPSSAGRVHKLKITVASRGAKVRHRLAYETKPR